MAEEDNNYYPPPAQSNDAPVSQYYSPEIPSGGGLADYYDPGQSYSVPPAGEDFSQPSGRNVDINDYSDSQGFPTDQYGYGPSSPGMGDQPYLPPPDQPPPDFPDVPPPPDQPPTSPYDQPTPERYAQVPTQGGPRADDNPARGQFSEDFQRRFPQIVGAETEGDRGFDRNENNQRAQLKQDLAGGIISPKEYADKIDDINKARAVENKRRAAEEAKAIRAKEGNNAPQQPAPVSPQQKALNDYRALKNYLYQQARGGNKKAAADYLDLVKHEALNAKKRFDELAAHGGFTAQDKARLDKLQSHKAWVEREVGDHRMSHADGAVALSMIQAGMTPLQVREQLAHDQKRTAEVEKWAQEAKIRAVQNITDATVRSQRIRELTDEPFGAGNGHYQVDEKGMLKLVPEHKVPTFKESAEKPNSEKTIAALPRFADMTPQQLQSNAEYKKEVAIDLMSKRAEHGLEHNIYQGNPTPEKISAAQRELSYYLGSRDYFPVVEGKNGKLKYEGIPESVKDRIAQLADYINGQTAPRPGVTSSPALPPNPGAGQMAGYKVAPPGQQAQNRMLPPSPTPEMRAGLEQFRKDPEAASLKAHQSRVADLIRQYGSSDQMPDIARRQYFDSKKEIDGLQQKIFERTHGPDQNPNGQQVAPSQPPAQNLKAMETQLNGILNGRKFEQLQGQEKTDARKMAREILRLRGAI